MKSIYAKIIIVLLCIAAGGFVYWNHQIEVQEEAYYNQLNQQLEPLKAKQAEIEKQLSQLKTSYDPNKKATLELVCIAPTSDVFKKIYPQMQKKGYAGIISLSPNQLPGQEEMMSMADFTTLMNDHWTSCLYYDGSSDFPTWLNDARQVSSSLSIAPMNTIYFASGTYQSSYDDILQANNITTIIHHGEENLATITDIYNQNEATQSIWKIGALAWNRSDSHSRFDSAIKKGGNIVFSIGGSASNEVYSEAKFNLMLENFEKAPTLDVTSIDLAKAYNQEMYLANSTMNQQYLQQKEALECQISDLDKQINEIIANNQKSSK